MTIYIPLEIPVRELTGHLLLSVVAASRGHQVFIASPSDIWLYMRLGLLKRGCYLFKNIRVPSYSMVGDVRDGVAGQWYHEYFIERGFDLYCQEQEPPILWQKFDRYLEDADISDSQIVPFKAVFCWGERDTSEFQKYFDSYSDTFFNTGSPRADAWCSRFSNLYSREHIENLTPYILFVSNFSLMSDLHPSKLMQLHKSVYTEDPIQAQKNLVDYVQEDHNIAFSMISAIFHLSEKHPDKKIVIRPHPMEPNQHWRLLFSNCVNVTIADNSDSISPWIAGAVAVIQSGCTSALETALQGIPLISFGPDRVVGGLTIPNKLGTRTKTLDELDAALDKVFKGEYETDSQIKPDVDLNSLITLETELAASKMIEVIETKSDPTSNAKINFGDLSKLRLVRGAKKVLDILRKRILGSPVNTDNFGFGESKVQKEIISEVQMMSEIIGVASPKVTFVSESSLLIGER